MTSAASQPRLWTRGGFQDDAWRHADVPGDAGANDRVILPLSGFLALCDDERAASARGLGVLLQPAEPVSAIGPFLGELALVALVFPAFSDGRSYSKAELLRRLRFAGKIRAVGDVLIDQIPLMLRTGFDEFEVRHPTALRRLEEGCPGGIAQQYQPAALPSSAVFPGGEAYSWRRRA